VNPVDYSLKLLPNTLHEVVKKYLERVSPDKEDFDLLKRLFEDSRSKELWEKFAELPEEKRGESLAHFISMAPHILSSAKQNKVTPELRKKIRSLSSRTKTAIENLRDIAALAVEESVLDDQRRISIQKRLSYLQCVLEKAFQERDGSAWLVAMFGDEYANIGSFVKRGSSDAEDIFITKALCTQFKQYFGSPERVIAGMISMVMRNEKMPPNLSRTIIRDRVRKRK
jgi:hypothetical protein